jgi:hypothetical protein
VAGSEVRATDAETEFAENADELLAEIRRLSDAARADRDREAERRLLMLRHRAGIALLDANGGTPQHPSPDFEHLPQGKGLPELDPADVTPELLRAGILRDGCVLVRRLMDRGEAIRFAEEIDRCFAECDRALAGEVAAEGYYEPFEPTGRFEIKTRPWVREGGGVLAIDSPRLAFEMLATFDRTGVSKLVADYLGEPAALSAQKTTLRRAEPQVVGAWHQDGAFMGDVRSLNLWLSLSRCGDQAPGLDLVPRRLDELVPMGTEGTFLPHQVSQTVAEEAAGDKPIIRPIFEPGDALFFDELFLHKTGSDASMPHARYAIESWFFGASAFPSPYAPIAL